MKRASSGPPALTPKRQKYIEEDRLSQRGLLPVGYGTMAFDQSVPGFPGLCTIEGYKLGGIVDDAARPNVVLEWRRGSQRLLLSAADLTMTLDAETPAAGAFVRKTFGPAHADGPIRTWISECTRQTACV